MVHLEWTMPDGALMQDNSPKNSRKPMETVIGVTAFKARCLELIDDVATGKVDRVVLTRRGKQVAEIKAPAAAVPQFVESSYGCMKGQIWIDPTWDPTEPFDDIEWDAEKGILFNE
jgi:antitoxin (DNA-binding transcriptional repressor) of toxin-antitoxin stability system